MHNPLNTGILDRLNLDFDGFLMDSFFMEYLQIVWKYHTFAAPEHFIGTL